jgi:hypothetical protein
MKLALYGQWEEVSGLIYTFPEKLSPEKSSELPEWAKSLFDPRYVRGVFKGDYCYAIWYNDNGYYYSCIKTNTDSRNGCIMLTLYAGKMVPMDGKQIATKIRMLLDYCLSKNNYTEIAYADVLIKAKEIEGLLTHRALPEVASSTSDKEMAYRLYRNEDELGLIMENPNQFAYASFKRVLVVEESAFGGEAVHSQSITQITEPIKKTYDIRSDSNDVVASKESVMEGEMFSITYRKAGYADECVEVAAGRPSTYYTIDSNVINLKPASVVGINFMKEIILQVVDEETKSPIKKWSCKIDGSIRNDARVENADGSVSFRIDPNRPHKIVFFADGYEDKTLELAAGEHGLKTVRLHSSDDSVFVRLQLGKEEFSGSVRMKSNNKLYKPLKRLDEKNKVLQVKRGFFSRRNLVPILLVFAIAAAAGVLLGRVTKKLPEVANNGNDSTLVAQLQERINSLNSQIDGMKEAEEQNAAIDAELLPLYGKALSLIYDKSSVNANSVKDILSKPEYASLLNGIEVDKNNLKTSLNGLIGQLNGVVARSNGGNVNPSGGGDTRAKTEEEKKAEDLNYFATNKDTWDLSKLQSNAYGNKFAGFIKSGSIINLVGYTGNSGKNYYNNANWKTICEKLNDFWNANQNNKEKVDSMTATIQTYVRGNIFDLNGLANFLQ